ncbi:sialic acid-binding Ig-like lectin 13-like, partial [Arapaima gigas]
NPSPDGEELYVNKAILSRNTGERSGEDEEDNEEDATLHYVETDFSNVRHKGKEEAAGVILEDSQKTSYAEIRTKPRDDLGVKECKAGPQDEEDEYAEVAETRPGAEGQVRNGAPPFEGEEPFVRGPKSSLVQTVSGDKRLPTEGTYGNICHKV